MPDAAPIAVPDRALLEATPRRHPDLAWRNWDGEVVILAPAGHDPAAPDLLRDGAEHDLNPVGSRIFELADGTRTLLKIAQQLVDEFEVDPATAEADACAFVADLVQKRLLLLDPAPPGTTLPHDPTPRNTPP